MATPQAWHELAQQLRVDSIRCTTKAGSGHPTSSMSAADLMAVLLSKYLHYDFDHPHNSNNDHLIFSKGHASPLLYSLYKAAGADFRRGTDDAAPAWQPPGRAPDAGAAVGGRGHRLAGPGAADWRGRRPCGQIPRQAALSCLGRAGR